MSDFWLFACPTREVALIAEKARRSSKNLVIAMGNPLRGDDGVGQAVLAALAESPYLPGDVALLDCSRGGLLNVLLSQDYERVIIVDATRFGQLPGSWERFNPRHTHLQAADLKACGSLHYAGLPEAMELAEVLGIKLPQIVIYGVQPGDLFTGLALSEAVQRAVPQVCEAILMELRGELCEICTLE